MFSLETYKRELVKVNGNWYIVDTIKAPDTRKWETGISKVDMDQMAIEIDADEELTDEDIEEFAEDYTTGWAVEQHPNKRVAMRRHAQICLTAELNED